ncbi:hypothetical protein FOG48_03574 [Hanseniaspora uvarum]|nr:hypothetical protein FOG48_03574 [Hanseniaspora uvarum]
MTNTIFSLVKKHIHKSLSTIVPTKSQFKKRVERYPLNPFPAFKKLNHLQLQFFFLGFYLWVLDSASFFCVSLTTKSLSEYYGESIVDVNQGIMYSLFLRVVGTIIFGTINDAFSRKYTYILICTLLCAIQVSTPFCKNWNTFLMTRCLFGMILGSSFNVGFVTANENLIIHDEEDENDNVDENGNKKEKTRLNTSLFQSLFQNAYPLGYLIAQGAATRWASNKVSEWKNLFYFTAALCPVAMVWRLLLPESPKFVENKKLKAENKHRDLETGSIVDGAIGTDSFFIGLFKTTGKYWDKLFYQCCIMIAFCYTSHGSQDLFVTLLTSLGYSKERRSNINIIANVGAIAGGTIGGYVSNYLSIRFTILVGIIIGCGVIYPWGYVDTYKDLSSFWLQFAVQFGFANTPRYLHSLNSYGDMPQYATIFIGTAYQVGTLASAPASTIQSKIAAKNNDNYSGTMSIFLAIIFVILFIITLFGIDNDPILNEDDAEYQAQFGAKQSTLDSDSLEEKKLYDVEAVESISSNSMSLSKSNNLTT